MDRIARWIHSPLNSPVVVIMKRVRFSSSINVAHQSSATRVTNCCRSFSSIRFIPMINWSSRSSSNEQWLRRISRIHRRVSPIWSFASARMSTMNMSRWKRPPTPSAIPVQMKSSFSLSPFSPHNPQRTKHRSLPIPMTTIEHRMRPILEQRAHATPLIRPAPIRTIPKKQPIRQAMLHRMEEPMPVTTEEQRGLQRMRTGLQRIQPLPRRTISIVKHLFLSTINITNRVFALLLFFFFVLYIWHSDSVFDVLYFLFYLFLLGFESLHLWIRLSLLGNISSFCMLYISLSLSLCSILSTLWMFDSQSVLVFGLSHWSMRTSCFSLSLSVVVVSSRSVRMCVLLSFCISTYIWRIQWIINKWTKTEKLFKIQPTNGWRTRRHESMDGLSPRCSRSKKHQWRIQPVLPIGRSESILRGVARDDIYHAWRHALHA